VTLEEQRFVLFAVYENQKTYCI